MQMKYKDQKYKQGETQEHVITYLISEIDNINFISTTL